MNSYGVDATAGYSAAVKLNTFAVTGFTTMGNSISAFTAQNMGAGRPERIRSGYRIGLLIIIAAVIPFTILYFFFAPEMVRLFMDPRDAENFKAIAVGVDFLKIVSPFFAVISLKLVADGVLRGAGAMPVFYDCNLFRPGNPCCSFLCFAHSVRDAGHLDVLAGRLGAGLCPVLLVLFPGKVENVLICRTIK